MVELNEPSLELGHHHSEAFSEAAANATAITPDIPAETVDSSAPVDSDIYGTEPSTEISSVPAETSAVEVDDYGNEIPPQEKVYTQAEVDARINEAVRRRLKERNETPAPQQQPTQQQPQNFQYDSNNPDSWEAQLEAFNENWFQKREQRARNEQYQRQEQESNAAFEVRFNQSAAKYKDFEATVIGKSLTPQMLTATRGMEDPAAFIYAAAKTQAPELERIARISDPYGQAIELGRLEERMRKARASVSKAPRPIDAVKGDMTERAQPKTWSIDDKLRQVEDANKKERMRGRSI